jgi:plasmid maintenance system killer protein
MKVDFKIKELEDYYYNKPIGKLKFQPSVYSQYKKVIDFMKASINFADLKTFTGLRIHTLKNDLYQTANK